MTIVDQAKSLTKFLHSITKCSVKLYAHFSHVTYFDVQQVIGEVIFLISNYEIILE